MGRKESNGWETAPAAVPCPSLLGARHGEECGGTPPPFFARDREGFAAATPASAAVVGSLVGRPVLLWPGPECGGKMLSIPCAPDTPIFRRERCC